MCRRRLFWAGCIAAWGLAQLAAADHLFFIEAQGIAGYSFRAKEIQYFSQFDLETMQKPSLGFDYLQRISSTKRDIAVISVQTRLALDVQEKTKPELQIYNAFLKFKTRLFDLWIGHNRPHFGLASRFDQHAHLLQPLVMNGFGFDRDWGIGVERQTTDGDVGISLTTGSGMALRLRGGWLLAGRLAKGILENDNVNVGLSFGAGKILDVMGNNLLSEKPRSIRMAELDMTWVLNNWENRFEFALGDRLFGPMAAALWRLGLGLLDENRLKLEVQPALFWENNRNNFQLSTGVTLLADADWTFRAMYLYDRRSRDSRLVFQVYFYKGLNF